MLRVNRLMTPPIRQFDFFKRQLSQTPKGWVGVEKRVGDNLLHHAIRHSQRDMESLSALFKRFDGLHISKLARETNDEGHIPLSMVDSFVQDSEQAEHIKKALLKAMLMQEEVKRLDEKIMGSMVLSLSDKPLQRNLKLARIVGNEARSLLKASATHPDSNEIAPEEKEHIRQTIDGMREAMFALFPMETNRWIRFAALRAIREQVGNCEEYSQVALYRLQEMNPSIPAELYRIANGDHCFLVIGRDPSSSRYDWRTWGDHVVVCDAWLGAVYPAREIPKQLIDTKGYTLQEYMALSFVMTFNPRYHRLRPIAEVVDSHSKYKAAEKIMFYRQAKTKENQSLVDQSAYTMRENHRMMREFGLCEEDPVRSTGLGVRNI